MKLLDPGSIDKSGSFGLTGKSLGNVLNGTAFPVSNHILGSVSYLTAYSDRARASESLKGDPGLENSAE